MATTNDFDLAGAIRKEIDRILEEKRAAIEQAMEHDDHKPLTGIDIILKDGRTITYKEDEYTEYKYDGKVFAVIMGQQWIGIFNIDTIEYITIGK